MIYLIFKIVFLILAIVGTSFIIPILTAIFCHEYSVILSFLIPMILSWVIGAAFLLSTLFSKKKHSTRLSTRASFVVVALAWTFTSAFGALPYIFSGTIPNITNAFFESVSGFTTTGASILSNVEILPRSINLWRCQTQWLGGMGIVALTVALFPILGVGGFQLIKAETTGPEKGKFTPKITTTAKLLWFFYMGMTVLETILLKIAGMDFLDALSHAFSTLGTGGFSTKNQSVAFYNSKSIDIIITIFMFLGSLNFTLYYYVFSRKFREIKNNSELKSFCLICLTAIFLITIIESKEFGGFFKSLRYSSFQVISILSTSGFVTSDYTKWKSGAQFLIFALFLIGGCSGSTAGGVKVIRWTVLAKQLKNEVLRMLHPHGVYTIRLNKQVGRKDVVYSVAAFLFAYILIIFATSFFASLFGIDFRQAISSAISMLGNVGPSFDLVGESSICATFPTTVKWWFCAVMLAGRLELYTIIIYLFPSFWK